MKHLCHLHASAPIPNPLLSRPPCDRYVAYTLPQDLQPLLLQPRILKWVSNGFLTLLKWDVVPQHPGKPLWDQRVVYTHAVLAFLGRNTYLLMSDLDEYVSGSCLVHPL